MRQEKPFKPLIIPAKLQNALPYRDKPKNNVKLSEQKKSLERVAVIKEPHEQKVNYLYCIFTDGLIFLFLKISSMMKMIKASYQHKQEKLKNETKQRMEKHRAEILAQEHNKEKKLKQKKKEIMRGRSKSQLKQDRKSMS